MPKENPPQSLNPLEEIKNLEKRKERNVWPITAILLANMAGGLAALAGADFAKEAYNKYWEADAALSAVALLVPAFLNERLNREIDKLKRKPKPRVDIVDLEAANHEYDKIHNLAYGKLLIETKDSSQWERVSKGLFISENGFRDSAQELNSHKFTKAEVLSLNLSILGNLLTFYNQLNRLRNLAKSGNFYDQNKQYFDLTELAVAGHITAEIKGVRLLDLLEDKFNKKSVFEIYRFFVECSKISQSRNKLDLDDTQDYPNLRAAHIAFTAEMAWDLMTSNPQEFQLAVTRLTGAKKAMAIVGKRFLDMVQNTRREIFKTLIDPDSDGFTIIKEIVGEYLNSDSESLRKLAVEAACPIGIDAMSDLYRQSRDYVDARIETEFYSDLSDALLTASESYYLNKTEIPSILDIEKASSDNEDVPSLEELSALVGSIFSKSRITEFRPLNGFDWRILKQPTSTVVRFDQNRPNSFKIDFAWESKAGDISELTLYFDTSRNYFDWSFIEDPLDPEMEPIRKTSMKITKSLLLEAERLAQEGWEKRHQSERTIQTDEQFRAKRVRPEITVPTAVKRKRSETAQESIRERAEEDVETRDSRIRNLVEIPKDRVFADLAKVLSHDDRSIVRNALEEYNEKGTGATLKKLKGGKGYGLRISTHAPGGIRIILEESSSEPGRRSFKMVDVRYRKDVYR